MQILSGISSQLKISVNTSRERLTRGLLTDSAQDWNCERE